MHMGRKTTSAIPPKLTLRSTSFASWRDERAVLITFCHRAGLSSADSGAFFLQCPLPYFQHQRLSWNGISAILFPSQSIKFDVILPRFFSCVNMRLKKIIRSIKKIAFTAVTGASCAQARGNIPQSDAREWAWRGACRHQTAAQARGKWCDNGL